VVIADTSVWIPFFNRPDSQEKRTLDALIDGDQLVLVGVVLAELIQGCRTGQEASLVLDHLTGLPFLETTFLTWKRTGELSFSLRRRGITLPLTDLIIAGIALEHDCQVFALDPHFTQIPGLKPYRPSPLGRKK
jgi:predicted nucleic acid-binding protein